MGDSTPQTWDWSAFRAALRLIARGLLRGLPDLRRRLDESDIVQQSLLQAAVAHDGCRATDTAGRLRWLRTVLVHELRDALDRETAAKRDVTAELALSRAVDESAAGLEEFLRDVGPSPDVAAAGAELSLAVANALFRLPDDEREVVIGHDLEGESLRAIAARLGTNKNRVAERLAVGRRRLRGLLAPHA